MSIHPALEAARRMHEDHERLLHLGADALSLSCGEQGDRIPPTHDARKSARSAEHLALGLARAACARGRALAALYDGAARRPPDPPADLPAAVSDFYERLRELKAAHRGAVAPTPGSAAIAAGPTGAVVDASLVAEVPPPEEFSGEESGGRYLDLQPHHAVYLNLLLPHASKGAPETERSTSDATREGRPAKRARPSSVQDVPHVDYVEYVKNVVRSHDSAPTSVRSSRPYECYLRNLLGYLISFCERLYPLLDVKQMVSETEDKLRADARTRLGAVKERYNSPDDTLVGMGADGVRDELLRFGLKCGGRPLARAKRLYDASTALVFPSKEIGQAAETENSDSRTTAGSPEMNVSTGLPGEEDADAERPPPKQGATREENGSNEVDALLSAKARGDLALGSRIFLEGLIAHILDEMLGEEFRATILNIEKKQSLSWVELEAERIAEDSIAERGDAQVVDDDNPEEERPLYNPKDVPLGWDGKPIPFWLYKLHGLNHEYRCEICGGTTYKGPRAFERHFADAQHVHGLRCLDITYSKQFYMVTRIADAVKLRDKLKLEAKNVSFNADLEVEFEDKDGNLLNKKTYQDLERQGLLS